MSDLVAQAVVLIVAFAVTLGATPLVRRLAVARGFVDRPHPRRLERKARLGGLAIVAGLVAGVTVSWWLVPSRTEGESIRILGLLLGGVLVAGFGVVDDRFELSPAIQLAGQLVAALVVVGFGVVIDGINNPLANSFLAFPTALGAAVTVVWLVGAVNAVNFSDGIDGLATGIVAIGAGLLLIHSYTLGQYSVATLPAALIGACLAFLVFNFPPARITLGTTGAAFLGFMLAGMSIIGGTKAASLLLVLGIPILDTAWLIILRLSAGRSPWSGDRSHLHHRLLAIGMGQREIVLLLYTLTAAFGSLAILIPTPLFKLYALGGMALVVLAVLVLLARRARTDQLRSDAAGGGL